MADWKNQIKSGMSNPETLTELGDVEVSGLSDNDILQYRNPDEKWENRININYDEDYKAFLIKKS